MKECRVPVKVTHDMSLSDVMRLSDAEKELLLARVILRERFNAAVEKLNEAGRRRVMCYLEDLLEISDYREKL